jgi:hypothetical protein
VVIHGGEIPGIFQQSIAAVLDGFSLFKVGCGTPGARPIHPKHAPRMNVIEIWLGILVKKVVKRGKFSLQGKLET